MHYKNLILFFILLLITNCVAPNQSTKISKISIKELYSNKGFTLVYDDKLFQDKIISKKLDNRSYLIFNRNLKRNANVKITNLINGKSIIAKNHSNNVNFPLFYNSVISQRISDDIEISFNEPYIEIQLIENNSSFIAKKTKTFDEEKNVAEKAPVDGITISDLNQSKNSKKETEKKKISFSIKIADFFYRGSAEEMIKRIKNETKIRNYKIITISETKFRVILGPFNDIKTLEDSYTKATVLNFDNLEILRNE